MQQTRALLSFPPPPKERKHKSTLTSGPALSAIAKLGLTTLMRFNGAANIMVATAAASLMARSYVAPFVRSFVCVLQADQPTCFTRGGDLFGQTLMDIGGERRSKQC